MKKVMLVLLLSVVFFSCNYVPTTDEIEQAKQEKILAEGQRQTGMPSIVNYQEKKNLKSIYELRDNNKLVNYAYLFNTMTGKLIFLGKCIGYGIPYATQYSNPQKVDAHVSGGAWLTMPQAEPNGLFMPADARGTWVLLLDKDNQPHPVYIEPDVIVSPFPLTIN